VTSVGSSAVPAARAGSGRAALGARAERVLRTSWLGPALSGLGRWLGLLAAVVLALRLGAGSAASGGTSGPLASPASAADLSVAAVLALRLVPALVLGPLAGRLAARWDHRTTAVAADLVRAALLVSVPLVGTLPWLLAAVLLVALVGLLRAAAEEATSADLPAERRAAAERLRLRAATGSLPVAALLFVVLAALSQATTGAASTLPFHAAALAHVLAAVVAWRSWPARRAVPAAAERPAGPLGALAPGWRALASAPRGRGLVVLVLAALAAGAAAVGAAPAHLEALDAGAPGLGLVVAGVATGLLLGAWTGPRLLVALVRWRLALLAAVVAGVLLVPLALVPDLVVVALLGVLVGACGGVAWVTGSALVGLEVADGARELTRAALLAAARVVLVAVVVLVPALAALVGRRALALTDETTVALDGAVPALLLAALLVVGAALLASRRVDDGASGALLPDLVRAWRLRHSAHAEPPARPTGGFLVALEGGDGVGKSTQARALAQWLGQLGHDVVVTREPGATEAGRAIRAVLLHGGDLAPRAEALLYAADRAQHVAELVRPALEQGALVITDRYVDSSVAYQGAGRDLVAEEVAGISTWATQGLLPDLTVVLDLPADRARARLGDQLDRLEREPLEFHEAVRQRFLTLARRTPRRYLVVDADAAPEEVARRVRAGLEPLLPPSPAERARRAAEVEAAERFRREAERVRAQAEQDAREVAEAARRAEGERREAQRARTREEKDVARSEARERSEAARARAVADREETQRLREEQAEADRLDAERAERAGREEAEREEAVRLDAERAAAEREALALRDRESTQPIAVPGQGPAERTRQMPAVGSHRALDEELFSLGDPDDTEWPR